MPPVPDRNTFESAYAGQAPWDIGKPQKPLLDVADRITGALLDAGCGAGDNALYFAQRGCRVVGIDFIDKAIDRARQKAAERCLAATFLVKDALTLKDWAERFDNVIDCGLFHVFSDEDRRVYVGGLATVLKPGGRLYLLCFSDAEPPGVGPRRVSRQELLDAFAVGWRVESLEPTHFAVRSDMDLPFSAGGPKAWLAIMEKTAARLPTLTAPGVGRTIAVVGDVYRFLATGDDTNGKYALWEAIVPPGGGPPPHVHSREEEGFYVLEGEITLMIDGKPLLVKAGMFANIPVGTPHSFKNESNRPARMLISVAPAGLEKMFFEVGVPAPQGATSAAAPTKEEIEKLMAVAPKYGIEIRLPAH